VIKVSLSLTEISYL